MTFLAFDPAAHRYQVGDRELPSVTTILKAQGLIQDRWFTEEARVRGEYVHLACRMLDDDELDESDLDPALQPYLEAYRAFLAVAKPDWTYIEHRVWDPVLGFAGTLDRAGTVYGERVVLDLKSGGVYPFVGPQTAAYRRCLPEPWTWKRAALHLKDDGTFSFHALTDRTDDDVFLAALRLHHWKSRHLA